MSRQALERDTGRLFEQLWSPYDRQLFEELVALFGRRLDLAGFDKAWLRGKTCLDAGCGGGRNAIAMARLGAAEVCGIDVGAAGIENAKMRAEGLDNCNFRTASIEDIPFGDEKFDLVWCAGVLMHLDDENRALDELTRVLKKDGLLYLLVYATGGMRWPLIKLLRPLAARIGQPEMERAVAAGNLPANKRRTFIDDLFCPKFDFFHWERLQRLLAARGYEQVERWGPETRLDHEQSLQDYRRDLEVLAAIFSAGMADDFNAGETRGLYAQGHAATMAVIDTIHWFEAAVAAGTITGQDAMAQVIGQGHHRLVAVKKG